MRIGYLFLTLLLAISRCFAQENNNWLAGRWDGAGDVPKSYYSTRFTRSMEITLGPGNTYTCIYTNGINDRSGSIKKELVKGTFYDNQFHKISTATIYLKHPPGAKWSDCSSCAEKQDIIIEEGKIKILYLIQDCGPSCDGNGYYYKTLSSFDIPMQRYLLKRFGTPDQIEKFDSTYPAKPIPIITTPPPKKEIKSVKAFKKTIASPLHTRATKPLNTFQISDREITLELFDDATEDGDTISIYDNGHPLVNKLGLRNALQQVKLFIDNNSKLHIITLVAENLGRIPPNTAVLRIITRQIREELQVRLTLKQNASIIFNYTGE